MKKLKSNVPFNYITIQTTQSRIDKGLLAIPVSLIDLFPKSSSKIFLINESGLEEIKSFTPYNSSSRECRIGGLKSFYQFYNINDGDEIVIQIQDDNKYRILPEKVFENLIVKTEKQFDESENEEEIEKQIKKLSEIANNPVEKIYQSEFNRLAFQKFEVRKIKITPQVKVKENVPLSMRKVLLEMYRGHCQVTDFTFLMKNGRPYFEIHHIDPNFGNHLKNLLVVCPNVHAQFTFAHFEQNFDREGWLRKVIFNEEEFSVKQAIDYIPITYEKEIHI